MHANLYLLNNLLLKLAIFRYVAYLEKLNLFISHTLASSLEAYKTCEYYYNRLDYEAGDDCF